MPEFKDRLAALRKDKDLGQKQLASMLGVARGTISTWEIGARLPEVGHLEELARIFNCSLDYLLGRSDQRNVPPAPFTGGRESALANRHALEDDDKFLAFLRGRGLTEDDKEAVRDLLEARRLRRQREEHDKGQS